MMPPRHTDRDARSGDGPGARIGAGPAAEIPILAGDNPERIREAAFCKAVRSLPDRSVARKDK
jgi:hypothetical protein